MKYAILIYGAEADWNALSQEQMTGIYEAYGKYSKDLAAAGVLRGGSELKPTSTATTVRVRDGRTLTTDGPFAETKEQLGGFYLVECANLDEAIDWAAKIPNVANGTVEIRPVWDFEADAPKS